MIGPAQDEPAPVSRNRELVHRLPVREALAGMADGRFHVDDGYRRERRERVEVAVLDVVFERFLRSEGADPESISIRRNDGNRLTDVLDGVAVHDDPVAGLERVDSELGR